MNKVRIIIIHLFVVCCFGAFSQTATVRGFLYFKENSEPALFTNVILKGTKFGVSTDVNGYYSLTQIPPGSYTISVTYLGYDTINESITLKANEVVTKKLFLQKSSIKLSEVIVSAEKQQKKTDTRVAVTTITPKELNRLPTIGGQAEVAQYIQVLPGVIFTGDQGGQLYIRGGTPVQNKVLLDGMVIYNPFHSIGLFSVFDADIIRNMDVYTAGFNSQYGGRVSSIMDITTRDGNKKHLSGKVSMNTFGAKLLLEGPIIPANDSVDKVSISYVLSAKNSYLPQTSKFLYKSVDTAGLPFGFEDFYGKISLNAPNGSKLNVFGFNFNDHVKNYKALADFGWKSSGAGSNFVVLPGNSQVLIKGNFSWSKYEMEMHEQLIDRQRYSSISGFNAGLNFTYFIGKSNIEYGLEGLGFATDYVFYNDNNQRISQNENTTEMAGYVKSKIVSSAGKFIFEPGLRGHYYSSLNNFSFEPRLSMKYNIVDKFRLKFAGGFYSQNLLAAVSDRDVVNLFYGFLSGPDNLQEKFTQPDGSVTEVTHHLQKAYHVVFGFEYDVLDNLDLNIEAYQKTFTQLANINRNKLYEDTGDNATKPDSLKKDFILESGKGYGIDFVLKYDNNKGLYLWAVYSLGFVTRWDGTKEYRPSFDRRHNINLVASFAFGKHKSWQVDARWNFGSGFPFTPTQGFAENATITSINSNYTSTNGTLTTLYGDYNSRELPYYHRLDLNIKKKFEVNERVTIEATAGVTNAYNRANIFYFDRIKYDRVNQLPFLPTVSFSVAF